MPLEERLTVWQLVKAERDGDILLEVSDAVRETLIADMDDHELLAAAKEMDADELADLAPELPRDVVHELMESLTPSSASVCARLCRTRRIRLAR